MPDIPQNPPTAEAAASPAPTTPTQTPEAVPGEMSNMTKRFIFIGSLIAIAALISGVMLLNKKPPQTASNLPTNPNTQSMSPAPQVQTTVTGFVDFDGYASPESYIAIAQRQVGRTDFNIVITGIAPKKENIAWTWNDATSNTAYEFVALLQKKGQTITQSSLIGAVAPAQGVVIALNSTDTPPAAVPAAISGTLDLHGYIPTGTVVAISERILGASSFTPVVTVPGVNGGAWQWNGAVAGKNYEVQAVLQYNAAAISPQQIQTITAPAADESIRLDSTATPPAPVSVQISGIFAINGVIPSNSVLMVGARPTGTTTFNPVANNIPAANGAAWSYGNAVSGKSYDLQAYLIVNGTPYAQSQILTVSAPASGQVFTINAQTQPPAPPANSINVSCSNKNSSNQWQATFNFNVNNAVQNAQQYSLIVGSSGGGSQMVSNITTPANPNQQQSYTSGNVFNDSTTYYAQYSYAACTNCNTFSPYSPTLQFSCH